jgi:hypothetical protein
MATLHPNVILSFSEESQTNRLDEIIPQWYASNISKRIIVMEKHDSEVQQQSEPDIGRGILRVMGLLLLVDIISLMLGVAFFLIAHGIVWGIILSSVRWQPANRLVRLLVFGLSTSGTAIRLTLISTVPFFISIALRASLIGVGVWFLVDSGFWGQNLIWIATH